MATVQQPLKDHSYYINHTEAISRCNNICIPITIPHTTVPIIKARLSVEKKKKKPSYYNSSQSNILWQLAFGAPRIFLLLFYNFCSAAVYTSTVL